MSRNGEGNVDPIKAGETLSRLDTLASRPSVAKGDPLGGILGSFLPSLSGISSPTPSTSEANPISSGGNQQIILDSPFITGEAKTPESQLAQTVIVGGLLLIAAWAIVRRL